MASTGLRSPTHGFVRTRQALPPAPVSHRSVQLHAQANLLATSPNQNDDNGLHHQRRWHLTAGGRSPWRLRTTWPSGDQALPTWAIDVPHAPSTPNPDRWSDSHLTAASSVPGVAVTPSGRRCMRTVHVEQIVGFFSEPRDGPPLTTIINTGFAPRVLTRRRPLMSPTRRRTQEVTTRNEHGDRHHGRQSTANIAISPPQFRLYVTNFTAIACPSSTRLRTRWGHGRQGRPNGVAVTRRAHFYVAEQGPDGRPVRHGDQRDHGADRQRSDDQRHSDHPTARSYATNSSNSDNASHYRRRRDRILRPMDRSRRGNNPHIGRLRRDGNFMPSPAPSLESTRRAPPRRRESLRLPAAPC